MVILVTNTLISLLYLLVFFFSQVACFFEKQIDRKAKNASQPHALIFTRKLSIEALEKKLQMQVTVKTIYGQSRALVLMWFRTMVYIFLHNNLHLDKSCFLNSGELCKTRTQSIEQLQ